jgi:hypothetical protein
MTEVRGTHSQLQINLVEHPVAFFEERVGGR